ncbi:MAG: hypothetical protein C0394_10295 [Syntrophus sp. (in: bacteria)]|nr:hypothetical protein [Syntrophus sp. (in: bacteria)]
MTAHIFKIRRDILIPFGISAGGLLFLLVLALLGKGSGLERVFLFAITLITIALFLIARDRRITLTDQGIVVRKFFRTKDIHREQINHVGCVILRKRIYLLLTTARGFIILSNAYEDFSTLIRDIVAQVSPEKVEEEVRTLTESSVRNRADVISLWFAVVIISGLIILKLSSI